MKFPEALPQQALNLRDSAAGLFRSKAAAVGDDPLVYPLLFNLAWSLSEAAHPVTLGVAGSQGSGKSTMAGLLSFLLTDCFNLQVAVLSLDDFYLPGAERQQLARSVHPLLAIRGVPGTHDHVWMMEAVSALRRGEATRIPVFDKSRDDRQPDVRVVGPVDVLICEGWCWGAVPQPPERLQEPVNSLESDQDRTGTWRRFVNDSLSEYQPLFETDASLYYAAPSMEAVYRWRLQQEQDLAGIQGKGDRVMDADGIRQFIACYERLTRWMLETRPQAVDICVHLREDHRIQEITRNA